MKMLSKAMFVGGVSAAALVIVAAKPADQEMHDHAAMAGSEMAAAEMTPAQIPDYADNFRLTDHQGEAHELYYNRDAKAVVIMTQGNGCPIVRNASKDLNDLKQRFADQGVEFFMLNSQLQDDRAEVAREAQEYGFDVPVLMDSEQLVGESLGVTRTAEVYILDPQDGYRVVYHGPINDRHSFERQRAKADNEFVADALSAMIAGETVKRELHSRIPGCIVNFPARAQMASNTISYAHDVAPILMDKCVDCHSEGGIGPWAMTDYQTIAGWAPMMRETIRTGRMPPWHADPVYGEFEGDRSLTPEQKKTLVHWIEAGAPRGDGDDPLAKAHVVAAEWPLGKPDLILDIPAQDVPASGVVDYVYPYVANPLKEDKWLRAATYKAGDRTVVHHILSGYISDIGEDKSQSPQDWEFAVGGYAVGAESQVRDKNAGVPLPAGGYIGFQMHYTPTGKATTDQSQVGLYFHDETPKLIDRTVVILDPSIEIKPNTPRHFERSYLPIPHDIILLSAFPHAHYRGYSSELVLERPDGTRETLLSLPRYDFNWQREYKFTKPVDVPAGSKLIANYLYDNSANNVANPDPSKQIVWGDQSWEEMLYTSLSYRIKGETTANRKPEEVADIENNRFYYIYDDNMDGVIQEAEFKGSSGNQLRQYFGMMDQDKSGAVDKQEFTQAMDYMRKMREQRQQTASASGSDQ